MVIEYRCRWCKLTLPWPKKLKLGPMYAVMNLNRVVEFKIVTTKLLHQGFFFFFFGCMPKLKLKSTTIMMN
jgi:hypothetical protein